MAKVHNAKKIGGKQIINLGSVGDGSAVDVSKYLNPSDIISSDNFFIKNLRMSGAMEGKGMWPSVTFSAGISYNNTTVNVSFIVNSAIIQVIKQGLSGTLYMII